MTSSKVASNHVGVTAVKEQVEVILRPGMAPVKFGLFKARSRDQPEQPSTENLLQSSHSTDFKAPDSPVPSTSRGLHEEYSPADLSMLTLDSDDEDILAEDLTHIRRGSNSSQGKKNLGNYQTLENQPSTSMSTLNEIDQIQNYDLDYEEDNASTSCDANSLQFDEMSVADSEDLSVYCAMLKKPKKSRSKEDQESRDLDMWQASNIEVMQNLLSRSGTLDDQIKWEAIATSRGLCTLTDSCTCDDCTAAKYLANINDGDGGLGAAPLFSAINVGCQLQ